MVALVIVLSVTNYSSRKVQEVGASTILLDANYLETSKIRIKNNDAAVKDSFEKLLKEANKALNEGPFSVTFKEKLPPSGNKHDYTSYSRYWWPNPNTEDGLPYIRHDGKTNPDSQNPKKSDRKRLGRFSNNTLSLALAYHMTEDEKYAKKAAELIRTWFIDDATKMNPNLNHSQCRLGHNTGSKSGILDGRLLINVLEGALLIENSSYLDKSDYKALQLWVSEYLNWLTTSELALEEAKSKNNHGSYYDLQVIYFALYCNNLETAKQIAQNFINNRVYSQINSDGSMPEELKRTRSLFYSIYNLHAMFLVARLSEKVKIDNWQSNKKSRLKAALDFLTPYLNDKNQWPLPTIDNADMMDLYPILKLAEIVYPNENYSELSKMLPMKKRLKHRANIAFPLTR